MRKIAPTWPALIVLSMAVAMSRADTTVSKRMVAGNATIDVEMTGVSAELTEDELLAWIHRAVASVRSYYGRFPVSRLSLRVRVVDGTKVRSGKTFPADGGGRITIAVGRGITLAALNDDWMLTHEMVHLAFPRLDESHHWLEEGLATYVEPWARVKAGFLEPKKVWADLVRDMPQGLPAPGDRGLDRTPTWGRTYWGGALYCLLSDARIRERTDGKKGLIDALRAINSKASIADEADIETALSWGDAAVGGSTLVDLYREMADRAAPVDLEALWKKLGIEPAGATVRLTDAAPLAYARRAIEKS